MRLTPAARTLLAHANDLFAQVGVDPGPRSPAPPTRPAARCACAGSRPPRRPCCPSWPATGRRDCTRGSPCASSRPTRRTASTCCSPIRPIWPSSWRPQVAAAHAPIPRFDQQPLLDDPLDLLVPARATGWPARTSVFLKQAADEPWLLDRPGRPHHQTRRWPRARAAGFHPDRGARGGRVGHRVPRWWLRGSEWPSYRGSPGCRPATRSFASRCGATRGRSAHSHCGAPGQPPRSGAVDRAACAADDRAAQRVRRSRSVDVQCDVLSEEAARSAASRSTSVVTRLCERRERGDREPSGRAGERPAADDAAVDDDGRPDQAPWYTSGWAATGRIAARSA